MKVHTPGTAVGAGMALVAMLLGGGLLAAPDPVAGASSPDSTHDALAEAARGRIADPATPLERHPEERLQEPVCHQVRGKNEYEGQTLAICEEQRNPTSPEARQELRDRIRLLDTIDPPVWCIDRAFTGRSAIGC